MTSKEIAAELKISKRTVEAYRRRIFAKLSLDSVGALTRLAIREGIV
jgi:DNA-binding CsgD family transcriptional regulator